MSQVFVLVRQAPTEKTEEQGFFLKQNKLLQKQRRFIEDVFVLLLKIRKQCAKYAFMDMNVTFFSCISKQLYPWDIDSKLFLK